MTIIAANLSGTDGDIAQAGNITWTPDHLALCSVHKVKVTGAGSVKIEAVLSDGTLDLIEAAQTASVAHVLYAYVGAVSFKLTENNVGTARVYIDSVL